MRRITNRKPGRCALPSCDGIVAVGAGLAIQADDRGPWAVYHTHCAPHEKACGMCGAIPASMGRHHNTNCGFWISRAHRVES
jgi:hypothetical protein